MTSKPRAFLDTNTLVSGIVFAGNERKLLDAIIDRKLEWMVSTDVVDETKAVLEKKFPKYAVLFPLFLDLVKHEEVHKSEYRNFVKECTKLVDKEDAPILAAVIAGQANYLVTGDRKILNLKEVKQVKIINTTTALTKLTKS